MGRRGRRRVLDLAVGSRWLRGGFLAGDGPGEHGAMVGGSLRLGTHLFGLGLAIERYPSPNSQLTLIMLDLSPIGLLGSLL